MIPNTSVVFGAYFSVHHRVGRESIRSSRSTMKPRCVFMASHERWRLMTLDLIVFTAELQLQQRRRTPSHLQRNRAESGRWALERPQIPIFLPFESRSNAFQTEYWCRFYYVQSKPSFMGVSYWSELWRWCKTNSIAACIQSKPCPDLCLPVAPRLCCLGCHWLHLVPRRLHSLG